MSVVKLPQIIEGYDKDDIWNVDETGVLGRLYLTVDLCKREKSVMEARRAKNG